MSANLQPLVSVVIPCYNHSDFVQDCILSVINQTYNNIELIIIDDGSPDDSVVKIRQMLQACQQRFVRFEFRSRANKGLSATLNEALAWCQGSLFSVIASDDQMLAHKTQKQVQYMQQHADCAACFGGVHLIDNDNNLKSSRLTQAKEYSFEDIILNKHDLPAATQMARLEIVKQLGGYNEKVKVEDWYMLLKMTANAAYKVSYLNEYLCNYRFHENNFSKNAQAMKKELLNILDEYQDHSLYKRAVITVHRIYIRSLFDHKKYFSVLIELTKLLLQQGTISKG